MSEKEKVNVQEKLPLSTHALSPRPHRTCHPGPLVDGLPDGLPWPCRRHHPFIPPTLPTLSIASIAERHLPTWRAVLRRRALHQPLLHLHQPYLPAEYRLGLSL